MTCGDRAGNSFLREAIGGFSKHTQRRGERINVQHARDSPPIHPRDARLHAAALRRILPIITDSTLPLASALALKPWISVALQALTPDLGRRHGAHWALAT